MLREFRVDARRARRSSRPARRSASDMFTVGQKVDVHGHDDRQGLRRRDQAPPLQRRTARRTATRVSHNTPGSIGMAQDPGRVFPGKRMAGHLGNVHAHDADLDVVRVDAERGLLLVKGAVPGAGRRRHRASGVKPAPCGARRPREEAEAK